MKNGHIIFLNGTSSAGKTVIAKALQEKLSKPYMHVSIDGFFNLYPERFLDPKSQEDAMVLVTLIPRVVSAFHKCVAILANAGNDLIVDHVLQEDRWLRECIESWVELDVFFVGVKCPLEIVEQREKERGDRDVGTARYQFERVHIHSLYDVEVDTSMLGVDECVTKILEVIKCKPKESAFQQLAIRFAV
jgi:chloramphenicol 3-O phosphotransferase